MIILLRLIISNMAMFICVLIGSFIPGMWTGVSGRDFRPQAINASILILVTSCFLRYKYKWPILEMFLFLIPTQFIILLFISYFSGYVWSEIFNEFNIQWLLYIDLFVCIPWITGIIIGSIILNKKSKSNI